MDIAQVNEEIYKLFPEQRESEYWSGCNYYINQGTNEWEPKGTASSMQLYFKR